MQAIGLTFIDWVIILIYFAFVLGIGWYLRKFTKSEEDFFLVRVKILRGEQLCFCSADSCFGKLESKLYR